MQSNQHHTKLVYQAEQNAKLKNQLMQINNPYHGSVEMQKVRIQQPLEAMKK